MHPWFVLLLAPSAAWAGDIVVYAQMPKTNAVAQVVEDAAIGPDLEAVTLPELMIGRSPVVVGSGRTVLCDVPPMDAAAVSAAVKRAESNVLYVDYDAAEKDIDAATHALGCLGQPARAADAARLYFLEGVIATERGDEDAAFAAFRQAHVYQPDLAWDPNFFPGAEAVFTEARNAVADEPKMTFSVHPVPEGTKVLVDGAPVEHPERPFSLVTGEHLVQLANLSVTTVRVRLERGAATLLVPTAFTADDAKELTSSTTAAPLSSLLATVVGEDTTTYVALPTGTWKGEAGDADFALVAPHDPRRAARAHTTAGAIAGGAVALLGGALAGTGYAQGQSLIAAMEAPGVTEDDYQSAVPQYTGARRRLLAGEGLVVVGLAVGGGALALGSGR